MSIKSDIWNFVRDINVKECRFATRKEITEFYCKLVGKPYQSGALRLALSKDGNLMAQGRMRLAKVFKDQYISVKTIRLGDNIYEEFEIGEKSGIFWRNNIDDRLNEGNEILDGQEINH